MRSRLELRPHASSPPDAISAIEADVRRSGAQLDLTYRITGDVDRLFIPPPANSERTDNLWQTTCPEAFIQPEGGADYYEFNLSPSTRWAGYSFTGYRTDMTNFETSAPKVAVTRSTEMLELTATVWLPQTIATIPWRLGLTTVIEETDGGKSFWALAHPSPEPDFHHSGSFTHLLPA